MCTGRAMQIHKAAESVDAHWQSNADLYKGVYMHVIEPKACDMTNPKYCPANGG